MSAKTGSTIHELDSIRRTLAVRDPYGETITVGSAAILAQFHGAGEEAPISCDDVDALVSLPYFERLLRDGPHMEDIGKFQIRWPKGRLKIRGATNRSIDIFPHEDSDLYKFTACYSMSDRFYQIDYDSCQSEVQEVAGLRCLNLDKILGWVAVIGRDKDIDLVKRTLPFAFGLGLVDEASKHLIEEELQRSEQEKLLHPERYRARLEGSVKSN